MLLVVLTACTGSTTTYNGQSMSDFFPLDGGRSATYTNNDGSVPYKLAMEKVEPTVYENDREVVQLEYAEEEGDTLLYSVSWSTSPGDAVYVHAYSIGTGASIAFDPPLAITDDDDTMRTGESVTAQTTGSDGASWTVTSTFVEAIPECPTLYTDKWTDCIHIRIDDGDGDDDAGLPFAGDYTLVTGYGPAYMMLTGDPDEWNLTQYTYVSG